MTFVVFLMLKLQAVGCIRPYDESYRLTALKSWTMGTITSLLSRDSILAKIPAHDVHNHKLRTTRVHSIRTWHLLVYKKTNLRA